MAPRNEPELREIFKKIMHAALDKLIEALWSVVEDEVIAEEELMAAEGGSVEPEKGVLLLPIQDAEKATVGVEDDGRVEEEDEEMLETEEIEVFICKITNEFKPEKLTSIVMNGTNSYEELAASIHLVWCERYQEEFLEVLPDISECWPEGYPEFFNLEGKKIDTSLPWCQFEKELHHIVIGLFE
ncbi:hypothetical protein RHGRI_024929 [Rhododendron griersonianum]|uniref:Uncharacterized protein n=1 Tax=Rhododendron griersonianum TaxID=479676 RepID=A0AAV6J936_9ERIC|nr:hypothetical protein RHGRI_024929 [Rhododendron griersonianum]